MARANSVAYGHILKKGKLSIDIGCFSFFIYTIPKGLEIQDRQPET